MKTIIAIAAFIGVIMLTIVWAIIMPIIALLEVRREKKEEQQHELDR